MNCHDNVDRDVPWNDNNEMVGANWKRAAQPEAVDVDPPLRFEGKDVSVTNQELSYSLPISC